MTEKTQPQQAVARRNPRQARALFKVELILEAATRLIDRGDVDTLTTNAVAAEAGVSIGTLYQYFKDKQAILEALVQREVGGMATKARHSLEGPAPETTGDRVRAIARAVLETYGGRQGVHRKLMRHALARGPGRLGGLYADITRLLSTQGVVASDGSVRQTSAADAFVLTHAVAGVLRGLAANTDPAISSDEVEDALVRLASGFLGVPPTSREEVQSRR